MPEQDWGTVPELDITHAHSARVYNYWLGGKDFFAADREAAEQAIAANPGIVADVRANRAFLARAVRFLADECGIRQFLDIGTGLPTASNTHEVAQLIAPESRIVYVDNDPVVLTHARALLTSTQEGATAYIDADLRDTETILSAAAATLDFGEPVALMLLIVLHMIPDADDPYGIVARLLDALPSGSYLVLAHPASDIRPQQMAEMTQAVNSRMRGPGGTMRDHAEVARFFSGLDLIDPGVVQPQQWRPGAATEAPAQVTAWCGIARTLPAGAVADGARRPVRPRSPSSCGLAGRQGPGRRARRRGR